MTSHNALGYRVLIAEDHPIEQKLLLAVLCPLEFTAKTADNGQQALSYLEAADFDLVIIDSHMPTLSGAEAIKAIRSRHDWKRRIPILLLIEDTGTAPLDQALAQASVSLTKPLDIARFISAATKLAKAGRALRHSETLARRRGFGTADRRACPEHRHLASDQNTASNGTVISREPCCNPLSR